jgi:hypothetical protein
MPWPLPPLPSLLPSTLFVVTIALAALAIFVVALIIARTLLSFVVAHQCCRVVVDALLPATARLWHSPR